MKFNLTVAVAVVTMAGAAPTVGQANPVYFGEGQR